MLVIRLLRIGKKHQPSYKIVVTDKRRAPKGGRFVAQVGSWDPLTKHRALDKDKIKEWISKGAKPSDTVHNMLVQEKIIEGKKMDVHKKSKKQAPAAEQKADAPKEAPAAPKEQEVVQAPVEAKKEEPKPEEKKE